MNCPFCGSTLAKVAAICPSCKIQLPESRLFTYYAAALERDKSLSQPEKRAKLDAMVEMEAEARKTLLEEAKEKARIEEIRRITEKAKDENDARLRQQAAAEDSQIKREEFFKQNGKKLKVIAVLGVLTIAAILGGTNYLKPESPKGAVAQAEIKNEPCIALGIAAGQITPLLNLTLEMNRDSGLSLLEIKSIETKARGIQVELMGTTNGQTQDFPNLEAAIIKLAGALGLYDNSLQGLNTESEILEKATEPLNNLAIKSEKACKSAGFGNQFKEYSGWEN
jgi:hypothetical protein